MTAYSAIADSDVDPESPISTTLVTRLRDNPTSVGEGDVTVPNNIVYGKLIAFHTITASNAVWSPNAKTRKLIVKCVGGGGNGYGAAYVYLVGGYLGSGGKAGAQVTAASTTVSGTYNAVVGNAGLSSSFIGSGISVTALGGSHGIPLTHNPDLLYGTAGDSCIGIGGAPVTGDSAGNSAAPNSGAGGGGASWGNTFGSANGGVGGSGIIYVWEYT